MKNCPVIRLDHNTTATQQWTGDNTKEVVYENSLVKPHIDKLVSESGWKVTPRLISIEEINTITGKIDFNLSDANSWYFFDSKTMTQTADASNKSKYAWLFDYTDRCTSFGCNVADNSNTGYWTSTPIGMDNGHWYVWTVDWRGYTDNDSAGNSTVGIRPVIIVSKNIIK